MELPALTLRQVGFPWNTMVRWFGVGATIPNEVIKRYCGDWYPAASRSDGHPTGWRRGRPPERGDRRASPHEPSPAQAGREIEKARREARNFADRIGGLEARGPWRETRLDQRVAEVEEEVRSILRGMDLRKDLRDYRRDLGRLALIGLFAILAIVLNVLFWLQELLPTSPTSMVSKGG